MQPDPRSLARFDEHDLLEQLDWLRGLARNLVSDQSAVDDLVHDAWLKARRGIPAGVSSRGELRRWLAAVARNLARTRGAREARRADVETRAQAQRGHAPGADELVERASVQSELAQEVLRLEPDLRDAVLLRYMEGLGSEEMGRRLSISPEAARKRVERGVRALRERLDARHARDRDQWLAALAAFGRAPSASAPLAGATSAAWLAAALVVGVAAAIVAWAPWSVAPAPRSMALPLPAPLAPTPPLDEPDASAGGRQAGLAAAASNILLLREESGAAASGYSVLRHDGARFARLQASDAEGRVEWPADEQVAALLVWRDDYALTRIDPPAPDAEQVAVLPEGSTLAGVVAGIEPGKPCHVRIAHDKPSERIDELGPLGEFNPFTGVLESAPPRASGQMLALGLDGSFQLRGLPDDWSGTLELRMPYVWGNAPSHGAVGSDAHLMSVGGPADLQLRSPTTELQATVASLPCASGRLVEGAEARPFARGTLGVQWDCGYSSGQYPIPVGSDGVFWLPLTPALLRCGNLGARLVLSGRDWSHALEAEDLVEGGDLGVVVVPAADLWRILVLDHEGRPLGGASVAVQEPEGRALLSSKSDHDGGAEFLAPPGVERLVRIAQAGHKPRYVRTGPQAPGDEPIVARLEQAAELLVRAVDASGRELQGALRVQAPLAADPARAWRDLSGFAGDELDAELRLIAVEEMALGIAAHLRPGGGAARIGNVARGIPLVVEWLDHQGLARASATTIVPHGEWSGTLELAWSGYGCRVRGRVRDQGGAAVAKAFVELGTSREEFHSVALTDSDGNFEFPALGAPLLGRRVFVSKVGHAPTQSPPRDIGPGDDVVLDLALAPARPLSIRLVDGRGRPVLGCVARADFPEPHGALPLVAEPGGGVHATSDAPLVDGTLAVELAGAATTHALPALAAPPPIVLEGLGALRVAIGPATLGVPRAEVELHARGSSSAAVLVSTCEVRADGTIEPFLLHLPPGAWTATVRARGASTQGWTTLGQPVAATVVAGVDAALDFP
ncbi:MAG: hypothetical protein RL112_1493 [Planctomycetota bacterium]